MVMLIILYLLVFQLVIYEFFLKLDYFLYQNGINGDLVENGGILYEVFDYIRES